MIGKRLDIIKYCDERGLFIAVNQIPFKAERIFFISNVPEGEVRGNHFSKTSKFLYILIKGACKVSLDSGVDLEVHDLKTGDALFFSKYTWMKVYDFSREAILCVLSDTNYNASDYVDDYNEFCRIVREKNV